MQVRALFWWDRLKTSFWFLPALMAIAAVGLSVVSVTVDDRVGSDWWQGAWWLFGGGAEGARGVLSVIASSMITVAGVVFSIMMVVLSLAAQQFGPRLLRNFMRDTVTKFVLGVFVATYLYCLMVLRTIRGDGHADFIPQISVSVGVMLATISLGVLIYFIHHVAVSIHIGEIVGHVQEELLTAVDTIFPEILGSDSRDLDDAAGGEKLPTDFAREAVPVRAKAAGYVEAVDGGDLIKAARENDLIVRLNVRPGDFILPEQAVMSAFPAARADENVQAKLLGSLITGIQRTPVQNIVYALRQQADIAVRALSPGINDPFTAMSCVEHFTEVLARITERRLPSALRYDEEQRLRIVAPPVEYRDMVQNSLGIVRQYARGSAVVTISVIDAIARLADRVRRTADRQALVAELDAITADPYAELSPHDLKAVREHEQHARKLFKIEN